MKAPTQNEKQFKEEVEVLMDKYNVGFRTVLIPTGRLSRLIHWATKRFYRISGTIIVKENETPLVPQPIP